MVKQEQKNICAFCGGSGQLSFFKGVSRFLLTTEECGECAGSGYRQAPEYRESEIKPGQKKTRGMKKKR